MTTSIPRPSVADIEVGFAPGKILQVVAGVYGDLEAVILEMIQNSLDAKGKRIWVEVNLKERSLVYRDNGSGISPSRMRTVLSKVGQSRKAEGALGQFGIGIWSPLTICNSWTATSCTPASGAKFHTWTFDATRIFAATTTLSLPGEQVRPDISGRYKTKIKWRTEFRLTGITRDRTLNRVTGQGLERKILTNFGERLRKQRTTIELKITDASGVQHEPMTIVYRKVDGRRLPLHEIAKADCTTRFEVLLVNPGPRGYQGELRFAVAGSDFALSASQLQLSSQEWMTPAIWEVVRSKLFHGVITGTGLTLNPSRKSFKRDESLMDFCFALAEWASEVAAPHLKARADIERDERLQRVGVKALDGIISMLRDPLFKEMRQQLEKHIRFGTQGKGHTDTGVVVGEQGAPAKRATGKPKEGASGGKPPTPSDTPTSRPGDLPGTVVGGDSRRRVVKNDSLGIQISYYGTEDGRLWELFLDEGRVNINTDHSLWAACERQERHMEELVKFIVLQVLSLLSKGEDWEFYRDVMDELTRPYVFLAILKADSSAGQPHLQIVA